MSRLIIIGGGVAGMSAGIYAQKSGLNSEIYESHTVVGGQCTSWMRKGFLIDNCVHWMTGTSSKSEIYKVWEDVGVLGENKKIIRHDFFLQVDINGKKAKVYRDLNKLKEELIEVAPEDTKEIKKFIKIIKNFQHVQLPARKPTEQMNFFDKMKLLFKMAKAIPIAVKYHKLTMAEYAQRFKSPLLKQIMINYLPSQYNIVSIFYMYANFTIGNIDLPEGGSKAISSRMEQQYRSLGGIIHTNKKATKIDTENGRATCVHFADGSSEKADWIICAMDTHVTFNILGHHHMDELFKKWYSDTKLYPVSSNVNLYYAIDKDLSYMPAMEIFHCHPFQVGNRKHNIIVFNNYAEEKDFAPQGKTVVQVLIVQDMDEYDFWDNLYTNDKTAYKAEKKRIGEEVKQRIEQHFTELKDCVTLIEAVTPKSFNRFCGSYKGSYMGFVQTPFAKKKIHPGILDGISNLYLAGQWLQAPGGLPNALITGRFAIQRLLKNENKLSQFCSKK